MIVYVVDQTSVCMVYLQGLEWEAFLQVGIQEDKRDAACFLLLKALLNLRDWQQSDNLSFLLGPLWTDM